MSRKKMNVANKLNDDIVTLTQILMNSQTDQQFMIKPETLSYVGDRFLHIMKTYKEESLAEIQSFIMALNPTSRNIIAANQLER